MNINRDSIPHFNLYLLKMSKRKSDRIVDFFDKTSKRTELVY